MNTLFTWSDGDHACCACLYPEEKQSSFYFPLTLPLSLPWLSSLISDRYLYTQTLKCLGEVQFNYSKQLNFVAK